MVTRETFETNGQFNKYLKIKAFFEKLIQLKKGGHLFMVDDEVYREPFIDGIEMGFVQGGCKLIFTGCTHGYNKKTEQYDIPWIDVTMKELRDRIVPMKRARL